MKGNITPLLPVNPLRDNSLPSGHLIQTTGETVILLEGGSKILAKPGSTFNFTSPEPGKTRANLLLGSLWVEHSAAAGGLEVQMAGKTIQPKGTEFVCQWDGAGGKVSVVEDAVSITDGASEETLQAGKEISLPQGTVGDYNLSQDEGGLVAGLPLRDLPLDEGESVAFGEYDPNFQDGQIPDDWLWQDPGSDAKWEASSSGGLMVTVPDGNEFWGYPGVTSGQRSDAPRLLHKVTGDFDLQGRVFLDTSATDLAAVEFLYYSPGSYIGLKSSLMKQDLLGEHYNLPGGGWLRAGGLNKLPVLGRPPQVTYSGYSAELKSAPDAPDEPLYLKFTRRGNILKTYHSLDGESWILSSREEVNLSQTIWIGWVFKRMAYDGLKDELAVVTLEDVRLKTAEPGTLPVPEWDQILQSGSAEIEGSSIRLRLDGSGRGLTSVQKGLALVGDFQATVSFQAENIAPQSGESRYLALKASNCSGQNSTYVGWISVYGQPSPQYITEFHSVGGGGDNAHDYTDDWSGKLRIVRQDGNISNYFWKNGDWAMAGNFQKGYPDPVYIGLEVCNEREAAGNASMTADFTIDEIVGDVASSQETNMEGDTKSDAYGTPEENDIIEPAGKEMDQENEAEPFLNPETEDIGDSTIRSDSAQSLSDLNDPGSVDQLIQALKDDDSGVRKAAALALGELGDSSAVDPLIRSLRDEDSEVRESAISSLGKLNDSRAVDPLMLLLADESLWIQQKAKEALAMIGKPAVEPLIQALKDSEWDYREEVADTLEMIGEPSVEPLMQALEDDEWLIRGYSAVLLGLINDSRAVDPLIALLKDENASVRQGAVSALGMLNDGRAIDPLISSLDDSDPNVRSSAQEALENLGWKQESPSTPPQRNFAFERWGAYNYEESSGGIYFTGYVPEPTYRMEDSSLPLLWEESGDKSLMALGLASEVLIDKYQEETITKNFSLNLSEGYQLHIMSVDTDGERAYLELTRYGEVLDSSTVSPNASFSGDTYCYKTDMGSAKDMVVIAVHFKNAFAGSDVCLATCDGVFQISSSPISYDQLERGGEAMEKSSQQKNRRN